MEGGAAGRRAPRPESGGGGMWRGGGVVQRGLQREREKGDERCVSRSSANDKHLCLISVIGMEGPDKSHQETGSKERDRLGTRAARKRLLPKPELYAELYSELFAE